MEEENLRALGASKAAAVRFLSGCGYRAAHLSKGRGYATADLENVKGRNIFGFNPGVASHRDKVAQPPQFGLILRPLALTDYLILICLTTGLA